jgi:hypothetical protein
VFSISASISLCFPSINDCMALYFLLLFAWAWVSYWCHYGFVFPVSIYGLVLLSFSVIYHCLSDLEFLTVSLSACVFYQCPCRLLFYQLVFSTNVSVTCVSDQYPFMGLCILSVSLLASNESISAIMCIEGQIMHNVTKCESITQSQ